MTGIGAGIAWIYCWWYTCIRVQMATEYMVFGKVHLGGIDTTSLTNLLGGFFGAMTPAIGQNGVTEQLLVNASDLLAVRLGQLKV